MTHVLLPQSWGKAGAFGLAGLLCFAISSPIFAFNVDFDLGLARRENLSRPSYWPEDEQEISVAARLRPFDLAPIWVTAAHVLHSARGAATSHEMSYSSHSGSSVRIGGRAEWAFHPEALLFGEGAVIGQGVLHIEGIQGAAAATGESRVYGNGLARFSGVIFGMGLAWEMTPFFITSLAWHRSNDSVHLSAEEGEGDADFVVTAQRLTIGAGVRW